MRPDPTDPTIAALVEAALPHVAFEGWSPAAFRAAVESAGIAPEVARAACPRGAVDLAVAYHLKGDRDMEARLKDDPAMTEMKVREKIAHAIMVRLDVIPDKEAVRRGVALFALPHMAAEGARLTWGTADAIWRAVGDTSDDLNWYTKRAILSGVWSATVIYWLGDDSWEGQGTRAFVERRIEDVMRFEKLKAQVRGSKLLRPFAAPLERFASAVKAPSARDRSDLPGRWHPQD